MNRYEKRDLGYDPERDIEGLYVTIPVAILNDKKLSLPTKIIAGIIALSCNNKTGYGHRSNRKIAEMTNLSLRAVERGFTELKKERYIQIDWDNKKQQRFYCLLFEIGKRFKR